MPHPYDDLDAENRADLMLTRDELLVRLSDRAEVFSSSEDLIRGFADQIWTIFKMD